MGTDNLYEQHMGTDILLNVALKATHFITCFAILSLSQLGDRQLIRGRAYEKSKDQG
jgi:hypothetical protein